MSSIKISQLPEANAASPNTVVLAVNKDLNRTVTITLASIGNYISNTLLTLQSISAFNQANIALGVGQAAYNKANSVHVDANNYFTFTYGRSNTSFSLAQTAFSQANAAYSQANTGASTATLAFNQANAAYLIANTNYAASNTAQILTFANAAYALANSKITAPTTVYPNSVLAFNSANTKSIQNCTIVVVNGDSFNNIKTLGLKAEFDYGNSHTAKTIYLSNGQRQRITLNANCTLTVNTLNALISTYTLRIIQDFGGAKYITWSGISSSRWVQSSSAHELNYSANGESLMSIYYDGTNMIQNIGKVGSA
jgi:hypothetical protein